MYIIVTSQSFPLFSKFALIARLNLFSNKVLKKIVVLPYVAYCLISAYIDIASVSETDLNVVIVY